MDLDQLRLLDAIARLGTLTAAAAELHVTQPALSRCLVRLEKDLGHRLFDRPGRRLVLNAMGAAALEHARVILREERALRLAVDDVARRCRALRVGTVAPAPLWRLTALAVERFPGLLMTSQMLGDDHVQAGLLDGGLDLGISARPAAHPLLVSTPLMEERLSVALPRGHRLAARECLRVADLDGETFLLLADIGVWRQVCEAAFPSSQLVVQEDREVFSQLGRTTALPYFVTDAPSLGAEVGDRVVVPIQGSEAHMAFHLLRPRTGRSQARALFEWVSAQ